MESFHSYPESPLIKRTSCYTPADANIYNDIIQDDLVRTFGTYLFFFVCQGHACTATEKMIAVWPCTCTRQC